MCVIVCVYVFISSSHILTVAHVLLSAVIWETSGPCSWAFYASMNLNAYVVILITIIIDANINTSVNINNTVILALINFIISST